MTRTSIEPRRKRGTKSDRYYSVNIWLSDSKQTIIEPRTKGDARRKSHPLPDGKQYE